VTYLLCLALVVAWGYWMCHGRPARGSTVAAVILSAFGGISVYDGVRLGLDEHILASEGVVVPGVVIGKEGPDDRPRSRTRRRSRRVTRLMTEGFRLHDNIGRVILSGSTYHAWVVDYRYACGEPFGCRGRAFMTEGASRRLGINQDVDVRYAHSRRTPSRLEDHPRHAIVLIDVVFGTLLLVAALFVSGRFRVRRKYLTAPAVVTAVEPVVYGDVTRWRIRFAYFDGEGAAQESADEVAAGAWKPGDDCVAVFRPGRPDLATLRSLEAS
jgi:hypothetical protein